MPFPQQILFNGRVVLDDAVMDDGQLSMERVVWVCIHIIRFTVGGPAGMSHPDFCVQGPTAEFVLQRRHLSLLFINLKAIAVQQRYARAVVAAVFKPLQPFYDERTRFPVPDVCYNAAHSWFSGFG